jgi:hypothetical protein
LVLRGEAGIGKTALLDYAVAAAPDFMVSRIAGVESEMDLGFAGLHRLAIPSLDRLDGLPDQQGTAMRVVFGLADERTSDRLVVGLATLSLMANLGADRPVLWIVDDVHWVDRESVEALALVGRRLFAERVALLFGLRDGHDGSALTGIPEFAVGRLDEGDAGTLLRSVLDDPLDDQVTARIVRETGGSPLAIVELASDLSAAELSQRGALAGPLPLSRRLEAHYVRQVRALPPATQTLLLVAAAEPTGDPAAIARAASRLGADPNAAEPAVVAGVFEMGSAARIDPVRGLRWARHGRTAAAFIRPSPQSPAPTATRTAEPGIWLPQP